MSMVYPTHKDTQNTKPVTHSKKLCTYLHTTSTKVNEPVRHDFRIREWKKVERKERSFSD